MQKYISKPDRKKLAERLGLKDSQVSRIFRRVNQKKNRINITLNSAHFFLFFIQTK